MSDQAAFRGLDVATAKKLVSPREADPVIMDAARLSEA